MQHPVARTTRRADAERNMARIGDTAPACLSRSATASVGEIAQAGELLLGPVRRTVESRAVPLQRRTAQIVGAELGDNAGVQGSAVLVLDRLEGVLSAI